MTDLRYLLVNLIFKTSNDADIIIVLASWQADKYLG